MYPNLRYNSVTPHLNLHQSFPAQVPVSSVNKFHLPPTPIFSYPYSGLPSALIPSSTPSQTAQPHTFRFKPQLPLKATQIKLTLIVHSKPPTIPKLRPRPSVSTYLVTLSSQTMPITYLLTPPPEHLPMHPQFLQWTIPSTNTLPSSVVTQPPTFVPPISQLSSSQPVLLP